MDSEKDVVQDHAQRFNVTPYGQGFMQKLSGGVAGEPTVYDKVNAPKHYCTVKYPYVLVAVDWKVDFLLAQVLKYIARNELKGSQLEDLKKAKKYLEMKIELVETGQLKETISHG